ncbi:septal ring lytic transglycosylase RlpA family protein [Leptolyngbya sp. AN02str]|uniref:septal ring lytic transglycosylase RlpA family protein n=1 Tax=Leptolyngbya sp. AN02str TaxID=3423363 RepID=UPI003D31DCA1
MKQAIWGSLATAAVMVTALGVAPSQATLPGEGDEVPRSRVSQQELGSNEVVEAEPASKLGSSQESTHGGSSTADLGSLSVGSSSEVSKVGEYQSQEEADSAESTIVMIFPHTVGERQAATLRVRSIPVFTFLGSVSAAEVSVSPKTYVLAGVQTSEAETGIKLPTPPSESTATKATDPTESSDSANLLDPVQQASAIATRINQLYQEGVNAESIIARWNAEQEQYIIYANDTPLISMGTDVILPDTTQNPAEDVLQATNRLRRLLGGAAPLTEIEGQPRQVAQARTSGNLRGMASWYGPGFHGNRSASGEVFNQNAMTAAHRSLPFGTQVRVTNLNTGQSVVVRINDRGPFSRGRVIDLSAAAARAIGLISSGIAPVTLEVLQ